MPATCFFLPLSLFSFADCRVYSVCSRCQTSVDTRSAFQPPTHIRQAGLDYRRQGAIFDSDSSLAWKSGTRSVQSLPPLDTGVLGCRARWGWGRKGVEGLAEELHRLFDSSTYSRAPDGLSVFLNSWWKCQHFVHKQIETSKHSDILCVCGNKGKSVCVHAGPSLLPCDKPGKWRLWARGGRRLGTFWDCNAK